MREDLPCQDAHRCEVVATPRGQVLIAVVSDGAGSASESARGAAYACNELLAQVERKLSHLTPLPTTADWLKDSVASAREGLLAEADRLGLPPRELAATLLCAVLAEQWSAFAQVGDGAIVTPEVGTDSWAWLFWPQRGEYANTTSFLTDSTAMRMLQVDMLPHAQHEVAMFTDGLQHLLLHYEQQTVHSPFFERMLSPIRLSAADGEDRELSSGLAKYLGSPPVTSRADDDLTLVMASRLTDGSGVVAPR
ncbi:MAG: PP2C family serine/threonine-protein phosphatase [Pseudonocardiaceae bacterium]